MLNFSTEYHPNNSTDQEISRPDKIRIVIADDHPVFREGLAMIVRSNTNMAVIAEAGSGSQLVQLVKTYKPDVVLSDIKMPDMEGIEAIRLIMAMDLPTRCILLSHYDNDHLILEALAAGAYGYLVKKASPKEIFDAIEAVAGGRQYFCRFASSKLNRLFSRSIYHLVAEDSSPVFSATEKQVISLLCEEKSSDDIGKMLFMSRRTVEGHKAKIMAKIGTKTTVGVVVYAIKNGLYQLEL